MKVKDLIEKLEKFDPELEVLIANEDDEIIVNRTGFVGESIF